MTDQSLAMPYALSRSLSDMSVLAIWKNPIIWKNFKSRMRMQALFPLLLVFIVATFMTFTIYGGVDRFQDDPVQAARAAILPLGLLQWLILMLSATGRITSGIIHERVTGTIEYTRLTLMSPMSKVLGYLFDLPVREYIAFAITMPFMVFLLIQGEIPLSVIVPVYLVFFSSALLYHMVGMVLGLVLREWRMSVVFTIGVVILINWVLPLFSYLGFPFLQYLTIRPVVVDKVFPYLTKNSAFFDGFPELFASATSQVKFYTWTVSTAVFSLILQAGLIFTFGLMVYRKWQDEFSHALGKSYALLFYVGLQLFCIGTLWPNLTFDFDTAVALGIVQDDSLAENFAFVIPLVYGFFSILCVFWLIYVITPTHDEYRSGLLREKKLQQMNRGGLSRFDDHVGSLLCAAVLAGFTFTFLMVVQLVMVSAGPLAELSPSLLELLKLPLVAVLVIFYFYVSLEYLQLSKFALLFLLVWIVPILLGVFLGVVFEFEEMVLYIGSVSPLTLITLAAQGLLSANLYDDELLFIRNAYWIGSAFILTLTIFLGYRMKLLKERTKAKLENES